MTAYKHISWSMLSSLGELASSADAVIIDSVMFLLAFLQVCKRGLTVVHCLASSIETKVHPTKIVSKPSSGLKNDINSIQLYNQQYYKYPRHSLAMVWTSIQG